MIETLKMASTQDQHINELLSSLTLDEKISLCHGTTAFSVGPIERLGLPPLILSDGPHGVAPEPMHAGVLPTKEIDERVTFLPNEISLASTWNTDLAQQFGAVLGAEARKRGKDVILAPGVNIVRTPLCGRNFEYLSEDPFLTARMAVATVKGVQQNDVAACVKHFAANNQEKHRSGVDIIIGERALREIYLPAFEAAVKEAGVLAVMGAYNKFRGQYCCHSHYLLSSILKREWGFDGTVISDWGAVHDAFEAAAFGLDIEMNGGRDPSRYLFGTKLPVLIQKGAIRKEQIDDKIARLLRVMHRIQLFSADRKSGEVNTPRHHQIARSIADESLVLLKNDKILPFSPKEIRKLLVVGDSAIAHHATGTGSASIKALYEVTPLDGIKKYLGENVEVRFIQGYPICKEKGLPIPAHLFTTKDPQSGVKGWITEIFDNKVFEGSPHCTNVSDSLDFNCTEQDMATLVPCGTAYLCNGLPCLSRSIAAFTDSLSRGPTAPNCSSMDRSESTYGETRRQFSENVRSSLPKELL